MDAIEFFEKANAICNKNYGNCAECVLTYYCCDGIFAIAFKEADEIINIIENNSN